MDNVSTKKFRTKMVNHKILFLTYLLAQQRTRYKPVGDRSPRLGQISLPWQQRSVSKFSGLPTLHAELNCRVPNHGWRRGIVALLQAILGSKFWALEGLNQKSKNNVL